jgi:hypothetical protein
MQPAKAQCSKQQINSEDMSWRWIELWFYAF